MNNDVKVETVKYDYLSNEIDGFLLWLLIKIHNDTYD